MIPWGQLSRILDLMSTYAGVRDVPFRVPIRCRSTLPCEELPVALHTCPISACRAGRKGSILAVGLLALLTSSCSGLSSPPGGLGVPNPEARSSSERPSWIDSLGRWQRHHPDREYFVGTTPKEPDQQSGRTDAYEEALRSVAQRVGARASALYRESSARQMGTGSEGMDMSVQRRVTSLVKTSARARISGVRIETFYWQKFWEKDQVGASPYSFYKVDVLVSLGLDQYRRLVRQALTDARDNSSDPQMKARLARMLTREGETSP